MAEPEVIKPTILDPDSGLVGKVAPEDLERAKERGAREATPVEIAAEAARAESEKLSNRFSPKEIGETWLAGVHAGERGVGEAIGVPLDPVLVGGASLFGKDVQESTRAYLKHLDEAHPYVSGWMGLTGQAQGALGASALLPGGGAAALPRTVAGVGARMAVGGIENVVAGTAHSINESSLGNADINGEKLLSDMPKHFLVGASLTGLFEGGSAALEAGSSLLARRVAPKLEEGADAALGREVGGGAAEGARVRAANEGEIPKTRNELLEALRGEQSKVREKAESGYAATLDKLGQGHAAEAVEHAEQAGAIRKGLLDQVEGRVRQVEDEGAAGVLDAMARGGKGVEDAELAGAALRKEAHGGAYEANMKAAAALKKQASNAGVMEAMQPMADLEAHYGPLRAALSEEEATARQILERLGDEHADVETQLNKALDRVKSAGHEVVKPRALSKDTLEMLQASEADREAGIARFEKDYAPTLEQFSLTKQQRDDVAKLNQAVRFDYAVPLKQQQRDTEATLKHLLDIVEERRVAAKETNEASALAHSESASSEVKRLQGLSDQMTAAREDATNHLKMVEGATRTTETQYAGDVAKIGKYVDARIKTAQAKAVAESTAASAEADKALANVKTVEKQTAERIEGARKTGLEKAEKARVEAEDNVTSARSEAEDAKERGERLLERERRGLESRQTKEIREVPKPSKATDVDPMIRTVERNQRMSGQSTVSGGAAMGAGFALMHGHPLGAVAALGASFVAGRARGLGNLGLARTMRTLSTSLTAVDESVRTGAAALLGLAASKVAKAAESSRSEEKTPSFDVVARRVREAQANPAIVESRVKEALGPIAKDAPQTYAATLAAAQRAQTFLSNILPPGQSDAHSLTPHLVTPGVSDTEKRDFMDAMLAIANPRRVLADATRGDLTEEKVQAVQYVYPAMIGQMRAEVVRQLSELKTPVPYARELQVGVLLGIPTDEVLDRDFQGTLSAAYQDKHAGGQPVGSQPKSGASKVASQVQSTSQKVESGEP